MVCKNCGHELTENEKFCPQCGQAVTPVETTAAEADSPIETPMETASSEETTKTAGDKKAQSVQWDAVKKNLQQGADKAAPILKAGFGKAKEFTAQTVHEFKDAASEVKGAGVSGASVTTAVKKINWKRLIPVAVVLVLLVFVVRACGGSGSIKDEEYFAAARQLISQQLKSPTSSMYSNWTLSERDKYGRTLVTVTVDSENSFGATLRNYAVVVIYTMEPGDDGSFTYNRTFAVQFYDNASQRKTAIDLTKRLNGWDQPIPD